PAAGAHDSARAADDACAAAPLARPAAGSAALRAASKSRAGPRAPARAPFDSAHRPLPRTPGDGLARLRRDDLALAHPGLLRARAALGGVARRRARVLLPRRAALLVAGDSALAEPRDLAALGHASLPSAGRSPEHGSLGAAHLLRPRALPELRAVA